MDLAIVGIDISKRKLDVALLVGGKTKRKSCSNDLSGFEDLQGWLQCQGALQAHACMEATGIYGDDLAYFLVEAGHRVSVVNPARIKGFGQSELIRTKTDKADAALIARFCAAMQPEPWNPPSQEVRELQALVRRLEALQEMSQQEKNRLEGPIPSEAVVNGIKAHIAYLDTEIAETERQIRDHFDRHDDLRRQRDLLTSIPGIAEKSAAVILAELRSVEYFDNARQLAAYAGTTPAEFISGSSVHRHTRLSKKGNWRLRKAIYYPALSALRCNPAIMAQARRLEAAGKAKMAIVGAAMRKLLHTAFGVLKSGRPFNPLVGQFA